MLSIILFFPKFGYLFVEFYFFIDLSKNKKAINKCKKEGTKNLASFLPHNCIFIDSIFFLRNWYKTKKPTTFHKRGNPRGIFERPGLGFKLKIFLNE